MTAQFRLRPGVHVAPVSEGLSIVGRGQAFVVPGPVELSSTWDALFPRLHHGGARGSLLAGLDALAGDLLLRVLEESGLLIGPCQDDWLGGAEALRFAGVIDYLESCAEQPYESFRRLHDCIVEVSGHGTGAFAAARALLNLGVSQVVLEDSVATKRLQGLADELGAGLLSPASTAADFRITIDSLRPPADGLPWVGVLLAGDVALIGPVSSTGSEPNLIDMVERFRSRTGRELSPGLISPVAAALAGNLAAMQTLSWLAGLPGGSGSEAILLHTASLRVQRYRISRPGRASANLDPELRVGPTPAIYPRGTIAPERAPYPPPADNWLLDVTDPASGLLDRPVIVPLAEVAEVVTSCTCQQGQQVYGYGPDAVLSARAAVAGSARLLVASDVSQLWDVAGHAFAPSGRHVAAAGYSVSEMLRDATRRLLREWWREDPGCSQLFTEVDSEVVKGVPGGDSDEARLRTFRLGDKPLWMACVLVHERLVALGCGPDLNAARRSAVRHAAVASAIGSQADPDPVATATTDEKWDPWPALESLAMDGTVLTGRWLCDTVLDQELVMGWVAIQPAGEEK